VSLKLDYNITQWDDYKVNYWGIPKCGNTSIKFMLMNKDKNLDYYNPNDWIHAEKEAKYIDRKTALSNGYFNFTIMRNPYDRVLSMYKDFAIKRKGKIRISTDSLFSFVNDLTRFGDHKGSEIHFRSQSYFIYEDYLLVDKIYHLEDTEYMVDNLSSICNYEFTLQKIHYTKEELNLNQDLKDIISFKYKKDFEIGGYGI